MQAGKSASSDKTSIHKEVMRASIKPLLALFAIPLITLAFLLYAVPDLDAKATTSMLEQIDKSTSLPPAVRSDLRNTVISYPPSAVCAGAGANVGVDPEYREVMCPVYSTSWHFWIARKVAFATVALGVITFAIIFALGALAFSNRKVQLKSFLSGWKLLIGVSAIEVIVQSAIAIWLSYWVLAYVFHIVAIKLVLIVLFVAAFAVFHVIRTIFRRPPEAAPLDCELILEDDAPKLWMHVRAMAKILKTLPPKQIVGGIDANFFVTEAPLSIKSSETVQSLTGRTLFVSLPLLRVLNRAEADAVLAHELSHFRGGDTANSAVLGPSQIRYDHYMFSMYAGAGTRPVFHVLSLYRLIFQIALGRESRRREFKADSSAAKLVSPQAIVQALVKLSAYSRYQHQIESNIFGKREKQSNELGISSLIGSGLQTYAGSQDFLDDMREARIPHPFDSHPSLADRMKNVKFNLREEDFKGVVGIAPVNTWIDDITHASEMERRLWADYEAKLAQAHEENLAYLLDPKDDESRDVVEKHFPERRFELKNGKSIEINFEGMVLPDTTTLLSWDDVKAYRYIDSSFGDILILTVPGRKWYGAKQTVKVRLRGLKKQKADFQAVLHQYYQRHYVMRSQQAMESRVLVV